MVKTRLKKEDQIVVISGNDKGKRGKILLVDNKKGRVIVEGVNFRKRHIKQQNQENQKGGIISMEFPIQISNVMYFCEKCKKGVRLGVEVKNDTKSRVCKKCGKRLD
jgi:large subunit ribosomal protein L24